MRATNLSPWSMQFIYGWQAENEDENEAGDEHNVHDADHDADDDGKDDDKRPVTI